jgi:prolyl-tRNA synthetase
MDRAGAINLDADPPACGSLAGNRRYEAYGPEMLRIRTVTSANLHGPTNEDMITGTFRAYIIPTGICQNPLPYPVEISRRAKTALGHARPRIPDEGCLFVRCGRSVGVAFPTRCSWLFAVFPDGVEGYPMRAETGPTGGDLSHEFTILAETGESAVFCHADVLICHPPKHRL